MKYECGVSKKIFGYGKELKRLDENYRILKETYFKSVCQYDNS